MGTTDFLFKVSAHGHSDHCNSGVLATREEALYSAIKEAVPQVAESSLKLVHLALRDAKKQMFQ